MSEEERPYEVTIKIAPMIKKVLDALAKRGTFGFTVQAICENLINFKIHHFDDIKYEEMMALLNNGETEDWVKSSLPGLNNPKIWKRVEQSRGKVPRIPPPNPSKKGKEKITLKIPKVPRVYECLHCKATLGTAEDIKKLLQTDEFGQKFIICTHCNERVEMKKVE